MLLRRLFALAAAAGVCVGFQSAPVRGLRLKGAKARLGARALRAAARAIDYGVAYDPRKRRLGNVQYETPWKVVEPRQEMCMSLPQTPQQRAVYDSVLLLRICVDGAEVKGVKWGLENV
tara:strand:+ start:1834 stop:2190 length:357 start_codon:yes stop_codon:yes gene_type:complete